MNSVRNEETAPGGGFASVPRPYVLPALDLRGGRCVRLVRGRRDAEIPYGLDPLAVVQGFVEAGAECVHIVDLGAALGEDDSREILLEIARRVPIPVQCGGGVRDRPALARLLEGGIARVLLGTRALADPDFLAAAVEEFGPERIVLALDLEGEKVRTRGWEEASGLDLAGGLALARKAGVRHLLVTATDRDGTLRGPRLELYERLAREEGVSVVAAGGIGSLEDVRALLAIGGGLEGVVIGRALYEGAVDLEEALRLAREARVPRERGP